ESDGGMVVRRRFSRLIRPTQGAVVSYGFFPLARCLSFRGAAKRRARNLLTWGLWLLGSGLLAARAKSGVPDFAKIITGPSRKHPTWAPRNDSRGALTEVRFITCDKNPRYTRK